jgi:hypothetical protein
MQIQQCTTADALPAAKEELLFAGSPRGTRGARHLFAMATLLVALLVALFDGLLWIHSVIGASRLLRATPNLDLAAGIHCLAAMLCRIGGETFIQFLVRVSETSPERTSFCSERPIRIIP